MFGLRDFKLYRWWKGGTWTMFHICDAPFLYWTRQLNLYSYVTVLEKEYYKHRRNIRGEKYE